MGCVDTGKVGWLVSREAEGVPLVGQAQFGLEDVATQGDLGLAIGSANFLPENFLDLTPCGGCGDDNGVWIAIEKVEGDVSCGVALAGAVARGDVDFSEPLNRFDDFNLLGPEVGLEDISAEAVRIGSPGLYRLLCLLGGLESCDWAAPTTRSARDWNWIGLPSLPVSSWREASV
jgi:hypothetical protein